MTQALIPTSSVYNTMNNSAQCRSMLQEAFERVGPTPYGHLAAGYRFYRYHIEGHEQRNQTTWAVRTEQMTEDLEAIDRMVGGEGNFGTIIQDKKNTHGSEHYKNKSDVIPEEQIINICCALWPEFLAYRDIVDRAVNLDSGQVLETYQMSWKRCNVTSWDDLEFRCNQLGTIFPINTTL